MDKDLASRYDAITETFIEIDTDRDNYIVKEEMYNHLNRYNKTP